MGEAIAIFVSLFGTFCLLLLPIMTPDKQEQARARARRMAEHRMNARLLRLNL
jgi:uncharacterized membrane protein YsdA (DUF1294 family)